MPKNTVTKETRIQPKGAAAPARAAKPKAARTETPVEVAPKPRAAQRVTSVKHSKAAAPAAIVKVPEVAQATAGVEISPANAHERIAEIAYGYWEARGFQPGSPEQDWLRAEREYSLQFVTVGD
jgi:hypothetical protein